MKATNVVHNVQVLLGLLLLFNIGTICESFQLGIFRAKGIGTCFKMSNSLEDEIPVLQRIDLSTQFGRWKLLQETLEEEADPRDINELLYAVLKSFVENPRPFKLANGKSNPAARLTDEQKSMLVEDLFILENGVGTIPILPESGEFKEENQRILDLLDKLQPDPIENEDDFRSAWDILVEMYGRESTKHAQKSGDVTFKYTSSIVRLLLHFEFLTDGVGKC